MPAKKKFTVELGDKSPKKHSVRFNAEGDDPATSSIYVSKTAIDELGDPERIKITIEAL